MQAKTGGKSEFRLNFLPNGPKNQKNHATSIASEHFAPDLRHHALYKPTPTAPLHREASSTSKGSTSTMNIGSGSETDAPPGEEVSAAPAGTSASAGARRRREEDAAADVQPESKRMRPARAKRKVDMIVDSEDDSDFWPSTDHVITDLPNFTPTNSRSPMISPARPRAAPSPRRTGKKGTAANASAVEAENEKDADFVADEGEDADVEEQAKVMPKKKPPTKKGKAAPRKAPAKGRKKAPNAKSATPKKAAAKAKPGSRQSKTAVSGESGVLEEAKEIAPVAANLEDDAKSGASGTVAVEKAASAIEMVTPPAKSTKGKGKKAAQPTTALQRVVAYVVNSRDDCSASGNSAVVEKAGKGVKAKKTTKAKAPAPKITKTITKSPKGKGKGKAANSKSVVPSEETAEEEETLPTPKAAKKVAAKSKPRKEKHAMPSSTDSNLNPVEAVSSEKTPVKTSSKTTPSEASSSKANPGKGRIPKAPPRKTGKAVEKKTTPKKVKEEKSAKQTPKGKGVKSGSEATQTPKGKKAEAQATAEKEKKNVPRATLGMLACSSRDSVTTSLLEHAVTQLGGYSMVDGSEGISISAYIIGADTRRGWGILYAIARGIPLVSESWLSASISAGVWLPMKKYLNTRFVSGEPASAPLLSGMRIKVAASGSDASIIRKVVTAAGARVAQTRCDLVINDGEDVDEKLSNVSKKWLADSIEKGRRLELENYLVASS